MSAGRTSTLPLGELPLGVHEPATDASATFAPPLRRDSVKWQLVSLYTRGVVVHWSLVNVWYVNEHVAFAAHEQGVQPRVSSTPAERVISSG